VKGLPELDAIYKWTELVNGKPMARYSNKPPASGSFEVVTSR